MDREVVLLKHLPTFLQEIEDFKALTSAEQDEFITLWAELVNVQNEQYLSSSTVYAVKRWEKVLGIVPNDDDTLDERKRRIQVRLRMRPPYTYWNLRDNLIAMCGENGYRLSVDPIALTIEIRISLEIKFMFEEVGRMFDKVLPVNLLLDYRLLYNTHFDLTRFTHAQLAALTHFQIKEEVLSLCKLLYNRHMDLKQYTHAQLKTLTHKVIKEEDSING